MKILIIEDEPPAAEYLERLIDRLGMDSVILGKIPTVQEAVKWLKSNDMPDLIFMDIQLSDGISFSIFEKMEIKAPIIFTTAYDKYALRAFKVNSIDYLLKPIDLKELEAAIKKWQRLSKENVQASMFTPRQLHNLRMSMKPDYKQRFLVKIGNRLKSIQVTDITFFFSKDKITYLALSNGKKYPIDYALSDVESLTDPSEFFRVSRQYLVSRRSASELIAYRNRIKIVMKHPIIHEILVSRDRISNFREWLDM